MGWRGSGEVVSDGKGDEVLWGWKDVERSGGWFYIYFSNEPSGFRI